jgi:prolyl-tRNA editing enzyme YbaK/EbsC (Cys-tRNA(Pro) deacylase)
MTNPDPALPASVMRVRDALLAAGLPASIVMLSDAARTSQQAADSLTARGPNAVAVGQIAKSLVFKGQQSGEGVLVIASGNARVDEHKVASVIGEPIGRADAGFVREVTGYAIGGIPPLGHASRLRVVLDRNLLAYRTVWAAAGHPHSVFESEPARLFAAIDGTVADVTLVVA